MPFQLSPGVAVTEKDFSSIVPAVSSSAGGFAGHFQWGPVLAPTTVSSENELVRNFGKPEEHNAADFFTAANFLSYTNNLIAVRTDSAQARNAVAVQTGMVTGVTVTTPGSGYTDVPAVTFSNPQTPGGVTATGVARLSGGGVTAATISSGGSGYTTATVDFALPQVTGGVRAQGTVIISSGVVTGITITNAGTGYTSSPSAVISGNGTGAEVGTVTIGNSIITSIFVSNVGSGYTSAPTVTINAPAGGGGTAATATATVVVSGVKVNNSSDYLQNYHDGAAVIGQWAAKYPGTLGNSIYVGVCDAGEWATWDHKSEFDSAPGTSDFAASVSGSNDELHVIVIDADGRWTGTPGGVLEKFAFVSKALNAKKSDGTNNYYKDVINSRSQYIWWMDHPVGGTNWGGVADNTAFVNAGYSDYRLSGGVDGGMPTDGELMTAWELLANDTEYDISLIPLGKASATVATYVINNVAETRKDCVVFISPENVDTGEVILNGSSAVDQIIEYRNALPSTSYAVMDSGYKYQYDRYNDKYRWIPLNGDVAGLCARTDYTNDPWFSPGGLNRGQIKNVVKLGVFLHKTDRDNLYKAGVNPVVTFPGEGTVLFGDKTLLSKPSAFDRINVRRLFIVLEKAIATAAKYQLFEFNDGFTRAQFKNLVEPFLRDVQGRRGITDFVVKCDESNNTGEVIDRNEFVADIFVKPNRSINFISLNFVAARSGINFSEIGA
jgi:hypothetical protein